METGDGGRLTGDCWGAAGRRGDGGWVFDLRAWGGFLFLRTGWVRGSFLLDAFAWVSGHFFGGAEPGALGIGRFRLFCVRFGVLSVRFRGLSDRFGGAVVR